MLTCLLEVPFRLIIRIVYTSNPVYITPSRLSLYKPSNFDTCKMKMDRLPCCVCLTLILLLFLKSETCPLSPNMEGMNQFRSLPALVKGTNCLTVICKMKTQSQTGITSHERFQEVRIQNIIIIIKSRELR
jgi:hypothetical protein